MAEEVVQEYYSGGDYEIYLDESGKSMMKALFDVEVGERCFYKMDPLDKDASIDAYVYSVYQSGEETALLYVSEDGRVIGMGTLLGVEGGYRLR